VCCKRFSNPGTRFHYRSNECQWGLPPKEIVIQDKAVLEQVELIQQLEEKEKNVVFAIIESFISKKKFKEFVQQNVTL